MSKIKKDEVVFVTKTAEAHRTVTCFYWREFSGDWTPFCVQKFYTEKINKTGFIGFRFYLN